MMIKYASNHQMAIHAKWMAITRKVMLPAVILVEEYEVTLTIAMVWVAAMAMTRTLIIVVTIIMATVWLEK